MQFLAVAAADSEGLLEERRQLGAWILRHPGLPIERFHATPAEHGGASGRWRWTPPWKLDLDDRRAEHERAYALVEPAEEHLRFGQDDVASMSLAPAPISGPALQVELVAERTDEFAAFTSELVGASLAVVIFVCIAL